MFEQFGDRDEWGIAVIELFGDRGEFENALFELFGERCGRLSRRRMSWFVRRAACDRWLVLCDVAGEISRNAD